MRKATLIFTRDKGRDSVEAWSDKHPIVKVDGLAFYAKINGSYTARPKLFNITKQQFKRWFGYTLPQGKKVVAEIKLIGMETGK